MLRPDALAGVAIDLDAFELNDALEQLAALNDRHAKVAELRLFGSLSVAESAESIGLLSTATDGLNY